MTQHMKFQTGHTQLIFLKTKNFILQKKFLLEVEKLKQLNYEIFFFFLTISLFLSCASTSKSLYYWGNYENTFYQKVNKPGDETTQKHIEEIKSIIEKANKNNTKYKNLSNLKVNYTPISNIKKAAAIGSVCFNSNRKVKSITI